MVQVLSDETSMPNRPVDPAHPRRGPRPGRPRPFALALAVAVALSASAAGQTAPDERAPQAAATAQVPPADAVLEELKRPTAASQGTPVSLADALQRAAAGAESVRIGEAQLARAHALRQQASGGRWPQLFGSGGYTRTLASEFEDLAFDFGDGGSGEDLGDLPFGQVNQWRLGLNLEQVLWDGGRIGGLTRAAEAEIAAAETLLGAARAEVSLLVAEAYVDALLFDRLVAITRATLELSETAYQHTRLAFEVGNQSEFDVLRAQVARDNQRPGLVERTSDRDRAYLRLKHLIDFPPAQPIALTTGFAELQSWELPAGLLPWEARLATPLPPTDAPAARQAWIDELVEARAPVRRGRAEVERFAQLLRAARAERWPTFALVSDYGRVAYPESGIADPGDMRTNWTVGAGFRVPLFTGGRVAGRVAGAEAELDEARARLDELHELALRDTVDALERLEAAEAVWQASSGTTEQAERAYRIADLRYREGLSTQLELSDARLLLQQALGNRALAARNLLVARARVALLPDLPIGGGALLVVPAGTFRQEPTLVPGGAGFTLTGGGGR